MLSRNFFQKPSLIAVGAFVFKTALNKRTGGQKLNSHTDTEGILVHCNHSFLLSQVGETQNPGYEKFET
jgi:hypothetical protein